MAKKKAHRQEKAAEQAIHNQQEKLHQPLHIPESLPQPPTAQLPVMEDQSDKIESLKSLNQMLLEETTKKRMEVNTLQESKKLLESQLSQFSAEIESLRSDLARVQEYSGKLEELKREVDDLVKENQAVTERNESLMREKDEVEKRLTELEEQVQLAVRDKEKLDKVKSEEISSLLKSLSRLQEDTLKVKQDRDRALAEKDGILASKVEEQSRLSERLRSLEAEVKEKGEAMGVFKSKSEEADKKNEDNKREIQSMAKLIDESNARVEGLIREKVYLERVKVSLDEKIGRLERDAAKLSQTVSALEKEREEQIEKLSDSERVNSESLVKQEELKGELHLLVEGNKEKKEIIDQLEEQKSHLLDRYDEMVKELQYAKEAHQLILGEKEEVEKAKKRIDLEKFELENRSDSLKESLSVMQADNQALSLNNGQLLAEVDRYKNSIQQINRDWKSTLEALEEEKINGLKLKEKNSELQKRVEDAVKELEDAKAAHSNSLGENEVLKSRCAKLVLENETMENELSQMKKQFTDMETEVNSKNRAMNSMLEVLKSTARQVSKVTSSKGAEREFSLFEQNGNSGDLEPYLVDLEVIKKAFLSREAMVEEMNQVMMSLEYSVTEARKKKSFWTMVSSATTVFAAIVSFAYASKLRT